MQSSIDSSSSFWQSPSKLDVILSLDNSKSLGLKFLSLLNNAEKTTQETLFNYLTKAIKERAYRCVAAIMAHCKQFNITIKKSDIETLAEMAAEDNDGRMVLLLEDDDFNAASTRLFTKRLSDASSDTTKKELFSLYMQILLRFMPIATVDLLVETFAKKNDSIKEIYEEAKAQFLKVAFYYSRYTKNIDLHDLESVYKRKFPNLKEIATSDFKYGMRRNSLAETLCDLLSVSTLSANPSGSDFKHLPTSSKGKRHVAYLMEAISKLNYEDQSNPEFIALRLDQDKVSTPINARYKFGKRLVNSVHLFSHSPNIEKWNPYLPGYRLYYPSDKKPIDMSSVTVTLHPVVGSYWTGGKSPSSHTWSKIEDLFDSIWSMKLKKPEEKATQTEKELYKQKLTQFYSSVAELVWLIGNTTPMSRGTGSVAELIFAIVHLHHGLQVPVLKREFPQLDVMDISFPVDDYKHFFTWFFEPSTIPEHLRFSDVKTLKQLYEKLNGPLEQLPEIVSGASKKC